MSTTSTLRQQLYEHSLRVILDNQTESGAFLACPTMPDYQFSWFRDGAFIAYALTLDGDQVSRHYEGRMAAQWENVYRFHDWCAQTINARQAHLRRAAAAAHKGRTPDMDDILNARYSAKSEIGPAGWPEFQLDGPGMWLWSLQAFIQHIGYAPLPAAWEQAVINAADYLAALWRTPCYDCWEERGEDVHISTLGAIFAGLQAAEALVPSLNYTETREAIRGYVQEHGLTPGGELAKSVGLDMVDANLLSVAVPHGLFAPDDPTMQRTVARIERELHPTGSGVHRHLEDTYYGGGVWVLLALWLGWYYAEVGARDKALALLEWAEAQADADGNLPEQVNTVMLAPDGYQPWVEQRGTIANPLLWTHAKYIILCRKLNLVANQ